MNLVIVTPIHNEASNIGVLARQLAESNRHPDLWVVVDDGSTDDGASLVHPGSLPFETRVVSRSNQGKLIGGSAFTAWQHGVDAALEQMPDAASIMKLDADVNLPPDYLGRAVALLASDPGVGLVGGILMGNQDREQTIHVPGPVKLYSRAGYDALAAVPRAVGFDVVDELAIKQAGLSVAVRKDLPFTVRRAIGASQGLVHGRRRNGRVCRWTGYWTPYFALHALRYIFRKPYLVGSVAMVYGYARAGDGPYDASIREAHAREQRDKLREASRRPISWVRATYGTAT
ncbi:glycosyltransferase family 2 protein [Sanguibacter suaedae]|uniref:Glycosyltransferase family 2 protein n=1 Tax=Sanguibacter suaedae TaxID=2795737 RepID=A0A934M867_9MICO|nr:glycosyltransferase family 2 protein [Sanguibacter suaedae]MBI9116202.1 glycosyltransferase family 2 protein [Sanguibacter suaedae]